MKKVLLTLGLLTFISCTSENSIEVPDQKSNKIIRSGGEVVEIFPGDILYTDRDTIEVRQYEDGTLYIFKEIQLTHSGLMNPIPEKFPPQVNEVIIK